MSEPSTGEISRNLLLIREDLKGLKDSVEQRPDWNDLRDTRGNLEGKITAEARIRELERAVADKAIKALEDWKDWSVKLIVGAVLVAVVSLVMAVGK